MKKMKKLASILLAAIMVLAMAVPAMAEKVSITDGDHVALTNHTFNAYQIFKGTQGEGSAALGDVVWGSGIKEDGIAKVIDEVPELEGAETAADVAAKLTNSNVQAFVDAILKYKNDVLTNPKSVENNTELNDPGYYLFVDTTDVSGKDDASNAALLQVTGKDENLAITVKTDKPSVEKKVKENIKKVDPANAEKYGDAQYNDVADYNIGDIVPFAFYSAVPNMEQYESYQMIFHDTMSNGLTFQDDVAIQIGNVTLNKDIDFTVTKNVNGFEVTITDLKKISSINAGDKITVTYNAKLNENAEIGLDGNPNTVQLEYSNNPDGNGTGKTTPDTVLVFTYELDVKKVDGKDHATGLADAEFVLYRGTPGDDAEYAILNEDGTLSWKKATKGDDGAVVYPVGSTLKSKTDGTFKVTGLDDGTYYLRETKAPAGYNLLTEDIKLVIAATTVNNQSYGGVTASDALAALTISVNDGDPKDGDKTTGIVDTNVENNQGAQLPETGGIGTTIFYVLGSILVLGAVILLITKKRMSVEK